MVLVNDPLPAGVERVVELPRYMPPHGLGTYWHIPRSAWVKEHGKLCVHLLCGQSRHSVRRRDLTDERPDTMLCGTCDGRANGIAGEGLIFQPRDCFLIPKRCPGGDLGNGVCHCGARVRYRSTAGGSYECAHTPGPRLARFAPCPAHGWQRMYPSGSALRCTDWECDWETRAAKGDAQ